MAGTNTAAKNPDNVAKLALIVLMKNQPTKIRTRRKAMQLSKLNDIQVAFNASNTQRIATNSIIAGGKIAVNTVSYTVANSTINGTSVTDSLKDQDTALLAAQLVEEVGAKEIGLAAHTNNITQEQQLALHAVLGCGLSAGAGGNCASGAVAGVTSEFLADKAYSNGVDAQNSILIGQATGAGAALLVSAAQGKSDEETAKNVSLGSFVGVNAATNNSVAFHIEPKKAGGHGHMSGYFQDRDGQWYRYDQGANENVSTLGGIFNLGYQAGVDIKLQLEDNDVVTNNLINDPNSVFIRTNPEQDQKIFNKAFADYFTPKFDPGTYRLCTNNCVDAVQNIFDAGNVKYPIDTNPIPNKYFEKLKAYYPNNQTNESRD
jgi:hypothetical protein